MIATETNWTDCTLGDALTLKRGYDLPERDRIDGEYPIVSSSGVTGSHNVAMVRGPGVITGRYGTLGRVFYVPSDFWPLNTSLYVQDFKGNHPLFIRYLLGTLNFGQRSGAAAVPGVNRNALHMLHIRKPDLSTQRKIAAILSAYDDLIENNLRRTKILEEMAQNLYREWFVKFRFPGHQQARFSNSHLGRIPEGWEVKGVGEVALNFDRLRKPLSSMQRAERKGTYPYYGAAKIFDYIDAYIFDGTYLLIAEDGSVVTTDRKPVLQYVSGKFWPNNHTHILQGKGSVSTEFLYMVLSEVDITGYITGAAQPKITQANLNRIPVVVAEVSILQAFNEFIRNLFREKIVLGRRNEALRRTRDLLMPRLISGEVDVSELDITVPEEAVT